jgi:hypothetical protein
MQAGTQIAEVLELRESGFVTAINQRSPTDVLITAEWDSEVACCFHLSSDVVLQRSACLIDPPIGVPDGERCTSTDPCAQVNADSERFGADSVQTP